MVDEVDVGEVVEVTCLACHDESGRQAGAATALGDLRLLAALGVDPFGKVRTAPTAVDKFELAGWVEWAETVAAWTAQPAREWADRNAGARPRVFAVFRVPGRGSQRSDLWT
jgi:hypothetical protein